MIRSAAYRMNDKASPVSRDWVKLRFETKGSIKAAAPVMNNVFNMRTGMVKFIFSLSFSGNTFLLKLHGIYFSELSLSGP
ncbi:MAG: hypothetical protein ACYC4H_05025 [Desulfocucumaceae bacterium]